MTYYKLLYKDIKDFGKNPDKKLGQHFLVDEYTISLIKKSLDIKEGDLIYEIGPGTGQLTKFLENKNFDLRLIELDKNLVEYLKSKFPDIIIYNEDILKFKFPDSKFKIVGNLPYYITSDILKKIVALRNNLELAVIMVQKNVADRILASSGNKNYGRLTVFLQVFFDIKRIKDVPGNLFYPPVKIKSTVLKLIPREKPLVSEDIYGIFSKVVKAVFINRRKTLINSLLNFPDFQNIPKEELQNIIKKSGFSPSIRGEMLNIQDFENVAKEIKKWRNL